MLETCGGSAQSDFTVGDGPPKNPSEWSWSRPSAEMTEEAENLIEIKHGDSFASPKCLPAKSLDGSGEFNFDCTAEDRQRGERVKLDVVVYGSDSGEPSVGILQNTWPR